MGRFDTDVDMTMQITLCDDLCYAKLIGKDNDKDSLKQYSSSLLLYFIEEQPVHLPNQFIEIDGFIINYVKIFDDVIINYSIPIIDMPPLLQTEMMR